MAPLCDLSLDPTPALMSCGQGRRAFARKSPPTLSLGPQGGDLSFLKIQRRCRPAAPRGLRATASDFLWSQGEAPSPRSPL